MKLSLMITTAIMLTPALCPAFINVEPTSLEFNCDPNTPLPLSAQLSVYSDPAPIPFTADPNHPSTWLSIDPQTGFTATDPNDPAVLTVSVTTDGIQPGTYSNTIYFTSSADPNTFAVPVTLNYAGPQLEVQPTQLDFLYDPNDPNTTTAATLTITNNGTGPMPWSASESDQSSPWLSFNPASGTLPDDPNAFRTITVTADPNAVPTGFYATELVIVAPTASQSPNSIPITFDTVGGIPPELIADPAQLSFSALENGEQTTQTLYLESTSADLDWHIEPAQLPDWLTVSPLTATASSTFPQPVSITVDPAALTEGTYTHDLQILCPAAANSPLSVPIELSIHALQPILHADPTEFTFVHNSQPPQPQTLTISNIGTGNFTWTVDPNQLPGWLSVSPLSGKLSTNQSELLTLTATAENLPDGIYSTYFDILAPSALNAPATITVRLKKSDHITVPDDFPTIQAAVDFASPYDTIAIAPGTYTGPGNVDITLAGKPLTITSEQGPDVTIIDCTNSARAFLLNVNETRDTIIEGLTITNGYAHQIGDRLTYDGGAIYCFNSDPTIRNCVFTNCFAASRGAAVYACLSSPAITDCTFTNNRSDKGTAVHGSTGPITRCTFTNNTADVHGSAVAQHFGPITDCRFYQNSSFAGTLAHCYGPITNCLITANTAQIGGAVYRSPTDITNCTIAYNTASRGGAVADSSARITNCIIYYNTADTHSQLSNSAQPTYSCIQYFSVPNTTNTAAPPYFTNVFDPISPGSDLTLLPSSPCIDAGLSDSTLIDLPESDLASNPRSLDGNGDTIPAVDMGAFEYLPPIEPTLNVSPTDLTFTAYPDTTSDLTQTLRIANLGPSTIDWQLTIPPAAGWLTASATAGSTAQPPDLVTITASPAALTEGLHTATITVTTTADTFEILVTLRVGPVRVPAHYPDLSSAISAARPHDTILVSPGTYAGPANRNLNFTGKPLTLRSTAGPAATVIDCENLSRAFTFNHGESSDSLIDGFTITHASAPLGAALYCANAERPTLTNCIFTANTADQGAAVYNHAGSISSSSFSNNLAAAGPAIASSTSTITDCTFTDNTATRIGGAITTSDLTITNSVFTANSAHLRGGAIANSTVNLTNTTFTANDARTGGAIDQSSITIDSCTFTQNTANFGGAIANSIGPIINSAFLNNSALSTGGAAYTLNSNITSTTFAHNTALWGAALANHNGTLTNLTIANNIADLGPAAYLTSAQPVITNSIIWNNFAVHGPIIRIDRNAEPTIAYSDLQTPLPSADPSIPNSGLIYLPTNFTADPLFADPNSSDFHLLSAHGRYDPYLAAWLYDTLTSPSIDAADPYAPWYLEPFPHGNRANLGAFGNTPHASKSPNPSNFHPDLTGDSFINFADLARFTTDYNAFPNNPNQPYASDFNTDTTVDLTDLIILADHWLTQN
ncbi:nitrous oxide reductase family maturation protein NosD [Anaerohalosphaera lusitana]|uniref:Nitrous oxide reductase family maturation protein NosD n=1 Tax=Anaerohalosphaera lusitana TaxID=1936003 RepID=A0A1U9NKH4_9BACT|nr:right-handed parallel beta-helix repeat-containing protein [Anaerohalosphaera lusitana]AQT68016.1 nitrous oxide reductase family maturation protein NosD [Anaerohalosphaera lusitana]